MPDRHGVVIRPVGKYCKEGINCIKACPTEAMRWYSGFLKIIPELCINCGECKRVCSDFIAVEEDEWEILRNSASDRVLICDPVMYTQFAYLQDPREVSSLMGALGYKDLIEEMEIAYDLVAFATVKHVLSVPRESRPMISVYCPAVLRLVQVKYPSLVSRLAPVENPLEVAAALSESRGVGGKPFVFVSPCPAKIGMAKYPEGRRSSHMSYAVGMNWVYRDIVNLAKRPSVGDSLPSSDFSRWIRWAVLGGESDHLSMFWRVFGNGEPFRAVVVSGMRNVMEVVEEVELGKLRGVDYVEGRVCDKGCVGGILAGESRFIASQTVPHRVPDWNPSEERLSLLEELHARGFTSLEFPIRARPRLPLSSDLRESMEKLHQLQIVHDRLPGINCGFCGRPSCRALAEDVVRGQGKVTDCVYEQRRRVGDLTREILEMIKLPLEK